MNQSSNGRFRYRAVDGAGLVKGGMLNAVSEGAALRQLLSDGLTPLEVTADNPAPARKRAMGSASISAADRVILLQELGTMLQAGVSVSECMPSLARAYSAHALGLPLQKIDGEVKAGVDLNVAMSRAGLGFPSYVHAILEAGEASGRVSQACLDASAQMDQDRRSQQEVRNALIYPAVLVLSGVIAVTVIFMGVVPRFATMLKTSRADIPDLSRWVIETGVYAQQHSTGIAIIASMVIASVVLALSREPVRRQLMAWAFRVPVVGTWLLRRELGRWATVLGTLLVNKVPIVGALRLSIGTIGYARMRRDLDEAANELQRGIALSDVLGRCDWFPVTRVNLIAVGERSGELPQMFSTLGKMEAEAAKNLQERALALIEPIAILSIGSVIGVIMVAVMMAISSLNTIAP